MTNGFAGVGGRSIAGLALTITLASCGGGSSGGGSGVTQNFVTGTGFDSAVVSIATARDGSGDAYAAGFFTQFNGATVNRLVRLNRDGSLDAGFDLATGLDNVVNTVETIDDGTFDVYVGGGFSQFRGNVRNGIVRVKPDGTEAADDFGFGFDDSVRALALNEGRGDLYAGGFFNVFRSLTRHQIARIDNPGGTADAGFDTGSGFASALSQPLVNALAVARDGTGNVYAGGIFDTYRGNGRNSIVRITPAGANDGSFDPGSGFGSGLTSVLALAVATDGSNRVYAGGEFTTYRGNARGRIARIMPNGANDGSFVPGAGFNNQVRALAVALDGSGDIYVGGFFTTYDGAQASRIARLNSDGSLDAGFATGSGFDDTVLAIAPATDGSGDIFVGGGFSSYNGTPVGRIARLNSDGSLD